MGPIDYIVDRLSKGGATTDDLMDATGYAERASLSRVLGNLRKEGRIDKDSSGKWHLAGGFPQEEAHDSSEQADENQLEAVAALVSIDELEDKLSRLGPVSQHGTKKAVLDRLTEILDPSIGDVLQGIKGDLERVAS